MPENARPSSEEMTQAWMLIFKPMLSREPRTEDEQQFVLEVMRREASANAEAFIEVMRGKP